MDIYEDAMSLFRLSEVEWVRCQESKSKVKETRPRPQAIVNR